jgi:hypothetical protein
MEKLFCMQVAAQLTVAACSGLGAPTKTVDPTLQDPNQRAVDLEVWEIFRSYYVACTQVLADETSWPTPTIQQGSVVPSIITTAIQAALPALSPALTSGPLGSVFNTLLKALAQPTQKPPTITGTIPAPGASVKPVAPPPAP